MATLSFLIGPVVGSGLAEFGIRVPFFVSSGMGAVGVIIAVLLLNESHPLIVEQRLRKRGDLKQPMNASPTANIPNNVSPRSRVEEESV